MTPILSPAILDDLRRYDTPTVCNVLELFDLRPRTAGYTDRRIAACYPNLPPMVGYACTATFASAAPPRAGDVYAGLGKQIELIAASPRPAVVVFQDLDEPSVSATFGEMMCTAYKAFGCAGLVTSGTGRDLDQVEALAFPCFTAGTVASHGYCQVVQLEVAVRVGGLTIHPGDLLHGDRNGIATIPIPVAAAVADACPELMAAEAVVLDYLKSGRPTPAGYAAARDECHRRIDLLGVRLRGIAS